MTRPGADDAGEWVDRLIADLASARIGTTFNQYAQTGGADADPVASPAVRRANLRLDLLRGIGAPVVIVAEAAGFRGARYSGLCLRSERQFDTLLGPFRRSSTHPRGFAETSATIVQRAIAPWSDLVLLWNVVPTHPCGPTDDSNRTPTTSEREEGAVFLGRVLDRVRPRAVIALGKVAAAALGGDVPVVRHPANGGGAACTAGLRTLLGAALGVDRDAVTIPPAGMSALPTGPTVGR